MYFDDTGIVEGALVRWIEGEAFGVVEEIWDRTVIVALDTGRIQHFEAKGRALVRVRFEAGDGERKIMLHALVAVDHPDLIDGRDRRRVCFDPWSNVESELVEYFGFGHPIIDELTRRMFVEDNKGSAAVRRIAWAQPGWQFNRFVQLSSPRGRTEVYPLFVSHDGVVDEQFGLRLLQSSRQFKGETSGEPVDTSALDDAHAAALRAVGAHAEALQDAVREEAHGRASIEEHRIEALTANRLIAAQDRLASCKATLERMKTAGDEGSRAVIPMWEPNVARAGAEIDRIEDDKERMLQGLRDRRNPIFEYGLLNVARIVPGDEVVQA